MWSEFLTPLVLASLLATTLQTMTPILFAALGETVAERSGVYNMGLEGTMLMAAFAAFAVSYASGSGVAGIFAGALTGLAVCLTLALLAVALQVEQIIAGLALNLLAVGATGFAYRVLYPSGSLPTISSIPAIEIPLLVDIPIVGQALFRQSALTYIALIMVPVTSFFLFRSRAGLRLRCAGENPKALDTRGLSVRSRQLLALTFSGLMGGIGGAFIVVTSADQWVPNITNGRGWLAIVAVIAGGWRPGRVMVATMVFALLDAIQIQAQGIGVKMPFQVLLAAPYLFAILFLVLQRSRAAAPAMLGTVYRRGG